MLEDKHDIALAFAARLADLKQQLAARNPAPSLHREITLLTRRIRDLGYAYDPRLGHLAEHSALDQTDCTSDDGICVAHHFDDVLFA